MLSEREEQLVAGTADELLATCGLVSDAATPARSKSSSVSQGLHRGVRNRALLNLLRVGIITSRVSTDLRADQLAELRLVHSQETFSGMDK
jgi:hypothetical protein